LITYPPLTEVKKGKGEEWKLRKVR